MIGATLVTLFGFIPLSGYLLYLTQDRFHQGDVAGALAYLIPLMVSLCGLMAIFEHQSVLKRQTKRQQERLGYLNMTAQAVASRLRREHTPKSIRRFLDRDLFTRDEKLYILYTGWRDAQDRPLSEHQIEEMQHKLYASRP